MRLSWLPLVGLPLLCIVGLSLSLTLSLSSKPGSEATHLLVAKPGCTLLHNLLIRLHDSSHKHGTCIKPGSPLQFVYEFHRDPGSHLDYDWWKRAIRRRP